MNEKKDFKPYIPAERITSEFTIASVVTGILLAVIFGAANAYLGLRVGLTISASIPAAVVAMGVIRVHYLYAACFIFMGRGRQNVYTKHFRNHTDYPFRRAFRCLFYGPSAKCPNR